MGQRVNLFNRFRGTLLGQPEKRFSDERIVEMCDLYERLFGHLDAIFSIARTKRFHLTTAAIDKCQEHITCLSSIWRRLGISVTPKLHLLKTHLIPALRWLKGCGDLGKDAGERAHQEGVRNDA